MSFFLQCQFNQFCDWFPEQKTEYWFSLYLNGARLLIDGYWLNGSSSSNLEHRSKVKQRLNIEIMSTAFFRSFDCNLAKPFQLIFSTGIYSIGKIAYFTRPHVVYESASYQFLFSNFFFHWCARVCKRNPLSETAVQCANFFHFVRNKALLNLYCRLKLTEFEMKRHCSILPENFKFLL